MTRVGITGHQRLDHESAWTWVSQALGEVLDAVEAPISGITSLAVGADQLFAERVLERGGTIEVVLPFAEYRERLREGAHRSSYDALLARASAVHVLARDGRSDEDAYLRAGQEVVARSELMVAVWNGAPAAGLGGTADIVAYARTLHRNLVHLDPLGRKAHWSS